MELGLSRSGIGPGICVFTPAGADAAFWRLSFRSSKLDDAYNHFQLDRVATDVTY